MAFLAGCGGGDDDAGADTASPSLGASSPAADPSPTAPSGPVAPSSPTASAVAPPTTGAVVPYTPVGSVLAYNEPIVGATVTLYAAAQPGSAPAVLASTTTGVDGRFAFDAPTATNANLYALTSGGVTNMRPGELSSTVVLGALLGRQRPAEFVINELTTVAGAFAASEYFDGESVAGSGEAIAEAAQVAAGVADSATGAPGVTASSDTEQLLMLNTLGNALSSCVWNEPRCAAIVAPAGREPASTTWSGLAATARDPWEVGPIFAIQQGYTAFSPTFQEAPPASGWVLLP